MRHGAGTVRVKALWEDSLSTFPPLDLGRSLRAAFFIRRLNDKIAAAQQGAACGRPLF